MPDALQPILAALGHDVVHVKLSDLRGSSDEKLAVEARDYDVFIAMDLHRQEPEWIAVNREIVESGIKVVRIRLPRQSHDVLLDVVRSITYRMEAWMQELRSGKCLITIGQLGTVQRSRTREEVLRMMEERGASAGPKAEAEEAGE